jgi:hypothetical protein
MTRDDRIALIVCLWLGGCGAGPLDAVTIDPDSLGAGQLAHWTFDDGSGAVVVDRSGNRHDGQLAGGSWSSAGRFGGALDLNPGDHVTVMNFPHAMTAWTVSVWVKMSAEQLMIAKAQEDWVTIVSTENVFAGGWQLHVDNRPGYDRFDAAYWAGSTVNDYVVASCKCIDVGQWIHLTAVFDGLAGELTFYRDDVVIDRRGMPMPILPGDPTLYIGRWNMDGRFLTATIDDFAIWSRALDRGEIAILSRQPPPDPR